MKYSVYLSNAMHVGLVDGCKPDVSGMPFDVTCLQCMQVMQLMQPASPSNMPCTCFELNNLTDTLTSQMYHRVVEEEAAVDPPLL
jgi:hypothetical protein